MNKLKNIIKQNRVKLNLTQRELADKLSITDKQVSKWETGVSYPDVTILKSLAETLEISVSELLSAEELSREVDQRNKINYNIGANMKISTIISSLLLIVSFVFFLLLEKVSNDAGKTTMIIFSILFLIGSISTQIIFSIKQKLVINEQRNKEYYLKQYLYNNLIYTNLYILLIALYFFISISGPVILMQIPVMVLVFLATIILVFSKVLTKKTHYISKYPKLSKWALISQITATILLFIGMLFDDTRLVNNNQVLYDSLFIYFVVFVIIFILSTITNLVLQFFITYNEEK